MEWGIGEEVVASMIATGTRFHGGDSANEATSDVQHECNDGGWGPFHLFFLRSFHFFQRESSIGLPPSSDLGFPNTFKLKSGTKLEKHFSWAQVEGWADPSQSGPFPALVGRFGGSCLYML